MHDQIDNNAEIHDLFLQHLANKGKTGGTTRPGLIQQAAKLLVALWPAQFKERCVVTETEAAFKARKKAQRQHHKHHQFERIVAETVEAHAVREEKCLDVCQLGHLAQ